MTVGELIQILEGFDPELEVYVANSPRRVTRVLGVIWKYQTLIIDPSQDEEDAVMVEP